jgi:hypothetical protein
MAKKFNYQVKGFKPGKSKPISTTPVGSRREVEKKVTILKRKGASRIETQVLRNNRLSGLK